MIKVCLKIYICPIIRHGASSTNWRFFFVWSSCKNILFHLSRVPRLLRCELYHLTLIHVICIKYILIYHLILFELKWYACYGPSCYIFDVSALLFDWVSACGCAFINNSITSSWRLSKYFDCTKSFCRLKTPRDV
jgi:hypothetical protein